MVSTKVQGIIVVSHSERLQVGDVVISSHPIADLERSSRGTYLTIFAVLSYDPANANFSVECR